MDVGIYSLTFQLSFLYTLRSFRISENGRIQDIYQLKWGMALTRCSENPSIGTDKEKAFHYILPSRRAHVHNSNRSAMEMMIVNINATSLQQY